MNADLSDENGQFQDSFTVNGLVNLFLFLDTTHNCISQSEVVAYPKAQCTFLFARSIIYNKWCQIDYCQRDIGKKF